MKKAISLALSMLLLLSVFPVSALAAAKTFTVMVYLCGTDLESEGGMGSRDLQEMVKSKIPADGDVTLFVQTGGTKNWQARGLDNRKVQRWTVSGDGLRLVTDVGAADMGDPDTLADFLKAGLQQFPADRYGLILWDHGSGASGGVCYDEMSKDALYMSELYQALQTASKAKNYRKFTFVGFDACLMASYEMACHLQPFAEYMVASEELEPGTGWSYNTWLPQLVKNPATSMEELGPQIVDGYLSASLRADRSEYATLSVLNLNKLDPVRTALEGMAASLDGQIQGGNLKGISRARQNVRSFGEIFDQASDMVDITVFANAYSQYDKANAKALKAALKDAMVYTNHTRNLTDISGLSVLVPLATRKQAPTYLPYYDAYNLSPAYTRFVKTMVGQMNGGSYSFGDTSVQQQSVGQATQDWLSLFGSDQEPSASSGGSLWDILFSGWEDGSADSSYEDDDGYTDDSSYPGSSDDSPSPFDYEEGNPAYLPQETAAPSISADAAEDSDFSLDDFLNDLFAEDLDSQAQPPQEDAPAPNAALSPLPQEGNPFANASQEDSAYVVTLTDDQLEHLAKAEANLMMDVSDPDFECYVELGYVQDVAVDWDHGKIYGMFDGTWPTLEGQMVCMYDQISNERYIRALIPITLNGAEQYLLVVFDAENQGGKVLGATEGYTESGMPARGYTALQSGDVIVPQYDLLYWDENDQQQTEPFQGDPITVGADGTVGFQYAQVENDAQYQYGFCLTNIYGDYEFTDFTALSY